MYYYLKLEYDSHRRNCVVVYNSLTDKAVDVWDKSIREAAQLVMNGGPLNVVSVCETLQDRRKVIVIWAKQ